MEWKESFSCTKQRVPEGMVCEIDQKIGELDVADIGRTDVNSPTKPFVFLELNSIDMEPYSEMSDNPKYKALVKFLKEHPNYYQYEVRIGTARFYSVFFPEKVTDSTIAELRKGLLLANSRMHIYYCVE